MLFEQVMIGLAYVILTVVVVVPLAVTLSGLWALLILGILKLQGRV